MSKDWENIPLSIKTNDEYLTANSILDSLFRKLNAIQKMNFNSSFEKRYYISTLISKIKSLQETLNRYERKMHFCTDECESCGV